MKETKTIYPDAVVILMYGILGRLKAMGGRFGDLMTIDLQLHETDMGAFNRVFIDYEKPENAHWEDKVPLSSIKLSLYPPAGGGDSVVLCHVIGESPRSAIDGPVTYVVDN